MKKFRLLAIIMTLCMCLSCYVPTAAAEEKNPDTYYPIAYSQANTLQLGEKIFITGTPNYGAYTSNESTTLLAVDTSEGTWFVAIGPVSVEAFKEGLPTGDFYLLGVYAGTMNTNGMPILDVQNGFVGRYEAKYDPYNYSSPYYPYTKTFLTAGISDIVASGQEVLDERAAKAQAEAEAEAARKAQEEAEKAAEAAAWKKTGKMVWIPTHGGECYHTNPHCSGMIDPEKVDLGYAKYLGFRDCSKC